MKPVPKGGVTNVVGVPIFYLHAGEHAFCTNPGCFCLKNETQLCHMLHAVIDRKLHMLEVINGQIQWRKRLNGS